LPNAEGAKKFFQSAATDKIGEYLSDLYSAWKVFLIAVALSFVFSLVYMVVLRCCAKLLMWVTFLAFFVLLAVIGYFFYAKSVETVNDGDKLNYQVLAVIFWVIDFILILVILCIYDDIQLALTVIETSGHFVCSNMTVLFVPIVTIVVTVGFLAYWIATVVFIYSMGEFNDKEYSGTPLPNVVWDDATRNLWYYHLFGLFWVLAFFLALLQFIIAATAAQWYFSSGTDQSGNGSVCRSLYWAFRYHLGSLALGSLLLAIITFIRFIFEYMKVRTSEVTVDRNKSNPDLLPTS